MSRCPVCDAFFVQVWPDQVYCESCQPQGDVFEVIAPSEEDDGEAIEDEG